LPAPATAKEEEAVTRAVIIYQTEKNTPQQPGKKKKIHHVTLPLLMQQKLSPKMNISRNT